MQQQLVSKQARGRGRFREAVGKRRTSNAKADPLLLARLLGCLDGDVDLLVALVEVLNHLFALLLDLGDLDLLLHDEGVHVLEQLGQLDHLLLDLLELLVAVLDGAEHDARLAPPVALHESLLEDLAAAVGGVLDGVAHLALVGVGPDVPVLALELFARLLAEARLDLLVAVDGRLEAAVDAVDLGGVAGARRLGARLDLAHPVRECAVHGHGLGRQLVQLALRLRAGRVRLVERPLLQHAQLVEVLLDPAHALVYAPALVQHEVGVVVLLGEGARVLG